jgi:NADH-quinone oxidoreductase subunit N
MNWQAVFTAMLPEHLLLLGIVLLILLEVGSSRSRGGALGIAIVLVAAAAAAAVTLASTGYTAAPFSGHLSVSPSTLLAKAIILALAVPVLLMARDEAEDTLGTGPFGLLLLSSLYGASLLVSSDSFLTLFLGLELMSLPVYVLVLIGQRRPQAAEAALKYLILGGAATSSFLMGASLLFGASGSLELAAFTQGLASSSVLAQTGVVLVLVSFFLKAAVVPFHTWAPDAYETASVPVTAYMATIVKAGVLLAALRLFAQTPLSSTMVDLLAILPLVSMVWGNLTAMRQTSFRRMIAYSSIAHAGYLFYAFLGAGETRLQAVVFYVLAYGLMNLLAFAALPRGEDATRDRLDTLRGLFRRDPFAALVIGLAMLSLAGIPPLPGFVAKFLIFRNVIAAGYTLYAVLGLIGSYLGIYFYLRVIQTMFMSQPTPATELAVTRRAALGASILCLLPALVVSVLPGWVIGLL